MSRIITKEDVKKHNNKRTVWVIIHNEVYDVTKFLDEVGYLFNYLNKPPTQTFPSVLLEQLQYNLFRLQIH